MRIFCLLLSAFWVMSLHAQKKVVINGNISGLADGTKIYLVPEEINNKSRDSVIAKNGSFHFQISIPEATIYSIRLSHAFEEGKWQTFYIGEGVLNIKGQNGTFKGMKLTGSRFVADYNNYRKWMNAHNIESRFSALGKRYAQVNKVKDTTLANKLRREYNTLDTLRGRLTAQWVESHRSSAIGPYLLYLVARGSVSDAELETALNSVSPVVRKDRFGRDLQEQLEAIKATAIGKMAPDFTQADTLGKPVSLHDFKGKYLLLDFWASWCVPCRAENPNVVAAFKNYQDKGFTVLSVSLDDNKEKWLQAIAKDSPPWTHISDLKSWDNAVSGMYNIQSIPSNLLIDPEGKIVAKDLRGDKLDKTIAAFLGVSPSPASDSKPNNQPPPPPPPRGL